VGVPDRPDAGEDAVLGQRLGVVDRGVLLRLKRSSQHRLVVPGGVRRSRAVCSLIWLCECLSREAAKLVPRSQRVLFSKVSGKTSSFVGVAEKYSSRAIEAARATGGARRGPRRVSSNRGSCGAGC